MIWSMIFNRMFSRIKPWGSLVCCSLLLTACAGPTMRIAALQTPEVEEAARYRKIALAPFLGQYGEALTTNLATGMNNAHVQGRPVYQQVLRVPAGRITDPNDPRALANFTRSLGAEALIFGDVQIAGISDGFRTQQEYICTRYSDSDQHKDGDKNRDKGKSSTRKCVEGYYKVTQCTDRRAVLQVQVSLLDARSSNLVYREVLARHSDSSGCGYTPPQDGWVMLDSLAKNMVDTLMLKLVPHDRLVDLPLMSSDDSINDRDKFDMAIKFAQEARLDRAMEVLQQLNTTQPNSPLIYYNLGICAESRRAYSEAQAYYQQAERLSKEPQKLISTALVRNGRNIRGAAALAGTN